MGILEDVQKIAGNIDALSVVGIIGITVVSVIAISGVGYVVFKKILKK